MSDEHIKYMTINNTENLKDDYSCLTMVSGEVIGYIDSFISIPVGGCKVSVNNEIMFLKKAKRMRDKENRSYRVIVTVPINRNENSKNVYLNGKRGYYYSFKKEEDEYICQFDELQWKYVRAEEFNRNADITEDTDVLAKDLRVWVYSEYYNDIFYNTITSVGNDVVYVDEFKKAIPKHLVFLTKERAENCKRRKVEYLKKDYNWLREIRSSLYGNVKLKGARKQMVIDAMENFLRNNENY